MTKKTLQELKAESAKLALEPARQSVDFIFDSLVNVTEHNKIPESLFRSEFLPYFKGDRDLKNANSVLVNWVGIAGTPMSEVDVVDDRTGEKLFSVPALYDTNILNLTSRTSEDSILRSVNVFNAESNNLPSIATGNLVRALGKRSEKLLSGNTTGQTQKRWDDILERYSDGTKPSTKKASVSNQDNSDDVEYE